MRLVKRSFSCSSKFSRALKKWQKTDWFATQVCALASETELMSRTLVSTLFGHLKVMMKNALVLLAVSFVILPVPLKKKLPFICLASYLSYLKCLSKTKETAKLSCKPYKLLETWVFMAVVNSARLISKRHWWSSKVPAKWVLPSQSLRMISTRFNT